MTNLDLFGHTGVEVRTQGIKYAGSKKKLLGPILHLSKKTGAKAVFDGFAGSTRVSQAFAQSGYSVISNDKAVWSKVLGGCYLTSRESDGHYQELIDHLNNVKPFFGWFSEYYGGQTDNLGNSLGVDGLKKPFQLKNTKKLDAIRSEIDNLSLSEDEKNVALTSLILALEKVDNTLGHYVSYLRCWSKRSYKSLRLELPQILRTNASHQCLQEDAIELASTTDAHLAYYDPPYGSNNEKMPPSRVRYDAYYHFWKTLILNDQPKTFGAACRRADSSDKIASSCFEDFRQDEMGSYIAVKAIDTLIKRSAAKDIILSYSSGGRATKQELLSILGKNGTVTDVLRISHKQNVMAHMRWTDLWSKNPDEGHFEYLFLLRR